MALRDVRNYYFTMTNQYIELQNDLADFNEAFKSGYITEDKLTEVTADVAKVKENLDRITYLMYLWEIPNRQNKKCKFKKNNQDLETHFANLNADEESVSNENKSIVANLKLKLKNLTKDKE